MKTTYLIITLFPFFSLSQSNVNTAGGNHQNSQGSISYTIGQITSDYLENSNGIVNEGVQQPYEFFYLKNDELSFLDEMYFFPNPTLGKVKISSEHLIGSTLTLLDLNGKTLSVQTIDTIFHEVDLSFLSPGVYAVQIEKNAQKSTLRIIKN